MLSRYRKYTELKAQREAVVNEVNETFKEKEAAIAEAKRLATERALVTAGIPLDLDECIKEERRILLEAAWDNKQATGNKTLVVDGGKIAVVERDACAVIEADYWDSQGGPESTGMSYLEAMYADIRTLVAADALEFLKISATAALAKAIPKFKAKGHNELHTIVPTKTQSVTITLDK